MYAIRSYYEFVGQTGNALRSSTIGTVVGILPGLGAAICNILAYGIAKKQSKHPEKFGTGVMDGIVASESSNNASTGGALVVITSYSIHYTKLYERHPPHEHRRGIP